MVLLSTEQKHTDRKTQAHRSNTGWIIFVSTELTERLFQHIAMFTNYQMSLNVSDRDHSLENEIFGPFFAYLADVNERKTENPRIN